MGSYVREPPAATNNPVTHVPALGVGTLTPFDIAFHHATPHGVLTAVHLPDAPDPVPEHVLARLPVDEEAYARSLRAYRQVSFVGGRLALRTACVQLGDDPPAILPDEHGAPSLPDRVSGSISHKRSLAVGMAGQARNGTIGVDLEEYSPQRLNIASAILTDGELATIEQLPEDRRWIALLTRFSIKEAIYKALNPYVRRYVDFKEAEVTPDLEGAATVRMSLAKGEGPFAIEARYEWFQGRLLTSVRARPLG